ncbi:MAG: phosphatase PAP2 family protein [Pseudonocardiaceae bacterium]
MTRTRWMWSIDFVADRLRPGATLGLLLTVQLGMLVALGVAFETILDDVTENDELVTLDAPVSGVVVDAREPGLSRFFEVISWAGSPALLVPLVLLAGLYLRRRTESWRPLIFVTVSLLGAMSASTLIKLTVARPRPPAFMALVDAVGYSFPSGHATAAAAGWLSLALAFAARTPRRGLAVALAGTAVVIAGLVGLSRVYLGVHAPTDVLGGWSLGALWVVAVLVALRLLRLLRRRRQGR